MKPWMLIALLAVACAAEETPPKDLLERDVFKRLLMASQLIEARSNHEMTVTEQRTSAATAQYDELFASEHITVQQYRKTFDWYAAHPDQLKVIYEEILVELQHAADTSAHAPSK
jgi:hypothetical protein